MTTTEILVYRLKELARLFKTLKDSGFDGPVLIELYSKDYPNLNSLYKPFDELKNLMAKVNG